MFFQKNYEDIRRLSAGGVQPNLNLSIVKSTATPIPPLREQKEIIEELDNVFSLVEKLEQTITNQLRRAAQFRQSILQKAFNGRLVPQDPNDKPASVLLERIRAEREAAGTQGKRGKKKTADDAQPRLLRVDA